MKLNKNMKILIVGLGLLGGSYAMALKKKSYNVGAVARRQSTIDYALENNIIDYGTTEIDEKIIGSADLIVFALYPATFVEWVEKYQHLFKSGAVITDVTGVKGSIVYKLQSLLRYDVEFISAHPMAGRELSGVENSNDKIFEGANYIVVPTEKNSSDAVELCSDLGNELGFKKVSCLSVAQHDKMIAYLSQLTHCIAVSLMCCNETEGLEHYTGDSFRDLTRIASINDEMWSELFLNNREALLNEMDNFKVSFNELYETVKNGDREAMREMMRLSTYRRKIFDKQV